MTDDDDCPFAALLERMRDLLLPDDPDDCDFEAAAEACGELIGAVIGSVKQLHGPRAAGTVQGAFHEGFERGLQAALATEENDAEPLRRFLN